MSLPRALIHFGQKMVDAGIAMKSSLHFSPTTAAADMSNLPSPLAEQLPMPAKKLASLQNFDARKTPPVSAVWSLEKEIWHEFFDSAIMTLRRADLEKAYTAFTH